MIDEDALFIFSAFASAFKPREYLDIDEWVDRIDFMLPSNTAESGKYRIDRAPYQKEILKAFSPSSSAKTIVLVFGSQMGKTTIENIVMDYYILESPSPIGFAFCDEENLKNYVKNKFNPMLNANPVIKECLKSEGKNSADSITLKQFPGGFLKFLSGKSESSMRSDSIRIMIADEVDAFGITKGGDVKSLLEKRLNTFRETSKLGLSSTPLNGGVITEYLKESTYRKYYMPCPHCGNFIDFNMDNFRYSDEKGIVKNAWMECPHCNGKIYNNDKEKMLDKGEWRVTNEHADPTYEGFYLPSFYAPIGWISFVNIAQEYVSAKKGADNHDRLKSFYNTVLAQEYIVGNNTQDWRAICDLEKGSPYEMSVIPSWVNFITTGADLQQNRIECSLYGWGEMGRSIAIEHKIFFLGGDELEDTDSPPWNSYKDYVLGVFEREDGLKMLTIANAIDSSYRPEIVYKMRSELSGKDKDRIMPVKGRDNLDGVVSIHKYQHVNNTDFWEVPVSSIKRILFEHLQKTIEKGDADASDMFGMSFAFGFDDEYYRQLYSEIYTKEGKKWIWKKTRERNEILDCTVYNLSMFYLLGFHNLNKDDWDSIDKQQRDIEVKKEKFRKKGRLLNSGVVI